MNETENANGMLNELTGDFGQSVPLNAGTSDVGTSGQFGKHLAVTKYNKTGPVDDVMRISSS